MTAYEMRISDWSSDVCSSDLLSMGAYGIYVLGQAGWNAFAGILPEAMTMGVVGAMALAVNVAVAVMLYAFRDGDANMRSVWLCSRRSEERRLGKECVRTCRSRGSPDH